MERVSGNDFPGENIGFFQRSFADHGDFWTDSWHRSLALPKAVVPCTICWSSGIVVSTEAFILERACYILQYE
jgi:hypothetical protein